MRRFVITVSPAPRPIRPPSFVYRRSTEFFPVRVGGGSSVTANSIRPTQRRQVTPLPYDAIPPALTQKKQCAHTCTGSQRKAMAFAYMPTRRTKPAYAVRVDKSRQRPFDNAKSIRSMQSNRPGVASGTTLSVRKPDCTLLCGSAHCGARWLATPLAICQPGEVAADTGKDPFPSRAHTPDWPGTGRHYPASR